MSEEKKQGQQEKDRTGKNTEKKPDTQAGKDATDERVASEEESGGALPSNHSDES